MFKDIYLVYVSAAEGEKESHFEKTTFKYIYCN